MLTNWLVVHVHSPSTGATGRGPLIIRSLAHDVRTLCRSWRVPNAWILENKSGGWWHPMHIHLEAHQVQKINGKIPPWHRRFKVDTTLLEDNGVAVIFMKFRTFTGPFVFHCHNLEHEDMRMMASFDPRPGGQASVLNGVDAVPELISGIPDGYATPGSALRIARRRAAPRRPRRGLSRVRARWRNHTAVALKKCGMRSTAWKM